MGQRLDRLAHTLSNLGAIIGSSLKDDEKSDLIRSELENYDKHRKDDTEADDRPYTTNLDE